MLEGTLQQAGEKRDRVRFAVGETTKAPYMFALRPGTREWDPVQVGYIHHPAVGFIDQW